MRDLTRQNLAAAGISSRPAPVRIVHLGLGAFHRAHQAWYTQRARDGWGIAAFTGRSPHAAETLAAQNGLYALVTRNADDDAVEIVTSISEAHDGADLAHLRELLSRPQVGVVTLTITEAGYRVDGQGALDLSDPDVQADIRALRTGPPSARDTAPRTPLGRLLSGLQARRTADGGPLAVVSCDNIPANGTISRRALTALAGEVDAGLCAWVSANVAFVSTSVDRITPAHTGEVPVVIEAGWHDEGTVVTEPFADWVLEGDFPAGRPAWENAGARFVDDICPWEDRKLWLLNGAHTILAVAGPARDKATVSDAFADPACRDLVEAFWAEAVRCLPDSVEHIDYRRQLAERFANARIVHRLDQIAAETTTKVRYRIVPIATRLRRQGDDAAACAAALTTWIRAVRVGIAAPDRESAAVRAAVSAADPVSALLSLVGADIDQDFISRVRSRLSATD
ncbi:mannitol dehydrogenase family protein [Microbacterium protaetiae]|uniref:Mannitol-1-phosphate 5-dehydrogenase n=1 Tax=Microbacterium protaetiae TaxID=2509458 RepID=A0A4P6ECE3_9MICO|nr:mannitol dehydrogenase family protein [Microbacterium protaetiae]QAY59900.1 mannitol dehydrogenase family protein [Microbacterium protaetiae]